jgi:cell division protein FtsA
MARNIVVGVDIGTHYTRVVVAEQLEEKDRLLPRIIGTGIAESRGLRHGYIVNQKEASETVREAMKEAERSSGLPINKAFLAVGGVGLEGLSASATVIVSRGDSEVTSLDLEKIEEVAKNSIPRSSIVNRRILHVVPIAYKLDGKDVLGRNPIGMKGNKLEGKILFITCLERHLEDLIQAVENTGVEVEDAMAAPLAASLVSLTKAKKIAGCVLTNIGSETTSIVIYENNVPVSLEVFPIGSNDITNDIALGLKIPLEEAEKVKVGLISQTSYPKKKLEEIISARLSDIFDLIETHLKKIGRSGLLPAGVILTGGGAGLHTIEEFARSSLKLPSKVSSTVLPNGSKYQIRDGSWSVAYGLTIWGMSGDNRLLDSGSVSALTKKLARAIGNVLKPFLP